MNTLHLKHRSGTTVIRIGAGLLSHGETWPAALNGHALIVTDRNVAGHYLEPVRRTLDDAAIGALVLPPGEQHKDATHWLGILDALAAAGVQRDGTVIALGGGVIGDLAGFAAASYMRGIRLIQVPTTLLAQVDAAIGGKTGFNLPAGKNLVGAFHQPELVVIDVATLKTLPEREYVAGLAEVIKYGAIDDAAFLTWLQAHRSALLARDPDALQEAVCRSVASKIRFVEADEREAGRRALLNFGHTFGHALEAETGYRRFLHGEAVAIGMALAATLSARIGLLDRHDAAELIEMIRDFGLPTEVPVDIDAERLVRRMRLDKKNRADRLRLILLEAPGKACIRDDITPDTLLELGR
ncbi:MAG: 3-dehydroquinate synthase [Wenzhouxiangellaceae bacterium]